MQPKTEISINPPNMQTAVFRIVGTAPLMTARFSKKAELMSKMAEGSKGAKRARTARNYDNEAADAAYKADEGWYGVNASSFRNALISACRLVNFKMTLAKLSIFIEADGFDKVDGTPLVRILDDAEYEVNTMHTRNATGVVDVRARPMWRPGWKMDLRIRYDADQFRIGDVANLLSRVGQQVGICEGRPDSKSSAGLGFGLFRIESEAESLPLAAE